MAEKAKQSEQPKTQQIVKFDNISDQVLAKINAFTRDGGLLLPENYSVANNMKSAWLVLQETTDRNGKPALEVCSKVSIANALFDMVLQGLSVSKSQGYFIVYGNKLEFQRSYFGTVALAKRSGGIKTEPVANVIYDGDDFIYNIDPKTGHYAIVKHEQKLQNIDDNKITGAYAIVKLADGSTQVTIMTIAQIRAAWNQGATKGKSPAHQNFAGEMAKKTVIGRACKMIINSADDAWLYEGKRDEMDSDTTTAQRDSEVISSEQEIAPDEVEYEDIVPEPSEVQNEAEKQTESDEPY